MSEYTILNKALKGETLSDVFIADCHGHLDYWKPSCMTRVDADSIIESMDRIGIDLVCINKWNCPDIKTANDDVGAAIKKYPDRMVGFAVAPLSAGRNKVLDELKRCFDELGIRGIKMHAGYDSLPLRDQYLLPEYQDAVNSVWEFAAKKRCPVLCHGFITPEVAKKYPDAIFIGAHHSGKDLAAPYANCKNVYFDTASSLTLRGNIEYLVEHIGVERVLYGSDLPYANPAYRIGQVIGTRIKDEQMRKILGENLAGILGITSK